MFSRLTLALLILSTVAVTARAEMSTSEMDQLASMVLEGLEGKPEDEAAPATSSDFVFDEPEALTPPEEPIVFRPPSVRAYVAREAPLKIAEELVPPAPLPAAPPPPASASREAPALQLGPRHVWFAGTSGPLRYGRGVLLRPSHGELEPRLQLRLQVVHRLASGEPSPVGFRVATNYLTWLSAYELEVQQAVDRGWSSVFTREGPMEGLLPVLAFRRDEVARLFCAAGRMRARLTVRDRAGRLDRTGWLEFRVQPPTRTYEGLALLSSPAAQATREVAGIPLVGARAAELWSLSERPRGAWTHDHLAGTLLAQLLLPLDKVPPLEWSRGHLGDPAQLDPVWYWEGDVAAALLARPPWKARHEAGEELEVAKPASPASPGVPHAARRIAPPAPPPPESTGPEDALPPVLSIGL